MNCERIRPLLSSYHDDALSPQERARVRAHLSTCADCSAVLTAYETLYAALQRVVAPVPPDLRRNVYARIAEIEARPSARPPFVPALLAMLRSAGATAGLLAVLAALLAALVRLGAPQHAEMPTAARGISAAGTALQHMHPSPIPTISALDGLVYVHRTSVPAVAANARASRGDLEWHAFAPGGPPPRPLVTPGPSPALVVTGLSASRDGDAVTYAVAGRGSDGGIFRLTLADQHPTKVLDPTKVLVPDGGLRLYGASRLSAQPSSGPTPHVRTSHLVVGQVFPLSDGRLSFSLVGGTAVCIAITSSNRLRTVARLGPSVDDCAVSPDMQRIAWVQQDSRHGDTLEVADLSARPITGTIGPGSHPVWAPDSRGILFLQGTARRSLALWSARDDSIRRLVTLAPAGHQFISAFAWAPGGRLFAYVVSSPGPHGTSTVWLGDTQSGYTWKSFARRWIGAIAWVHGGALQTTAPPPSATPAPSVETAAAVTPSPKPAAPPIATPTPYDNTTTPADALLSFYNAINRQDFRRAYSYLSYTDGRSLPQFMAGYADTRYDQIVRLLPALYLTASNYHALTCVGIQLLAHNQNGQTVRYGGWYLVKNTTGQNPHFAGWRIQMPGTDVKRGGTARVPPQSRCVEPPPTPTAGAG